MDGGGGAFIKKIMFNLCCTESNALFPANQRTESAQQPITAELALVSFVSALIFCLQTQFKPNFFSEILTMQCGVFIVKM